MYLESPSDQLASQIVVAKHLQCIFQQQTMYPTGMPYKPNNPQATLYAEFLAESNGFQN